MCCTPYRFTDEDVEQTKKAAELQSEAIRNYMAENNIPIPESSDRAQ